MATGACGVNCDVCKLNIEGKCSTCGPGKSEVGTYKLAVQKKLFGTGCPILACAILNQINHCMSDCDQFPCVNFSTGPYPFSQGFLDMQSRRMKAVPAKPIKPDIVVPPVYWDDLLAKEKQALCNFTLSFPHDTGITFPFLHTDILVDTAQKCLKIRLDEHWQPLDDPMLELATLVYFNRVTALYPKGKTLVGVKDLKEATFFKGRYALELDLLLKRFKDDPPAFKRAAEYLNAETMDMADIAYMFLPFPRIPIYVLLWEKDKDFNAKIDVLFDISIDRCLNAPAIWALVNCVIHYILETTK